jgi:arginine decarboxylase
MTTSPNVMIYAAIDGWRRQMVEHGVTNCSVSLWISRAKCENASSRSLTLR